MCVIPLDADKFDVTRGSCLYDWWFLNGFTHSNHLVPNRAAKKSSLLLFSRRFYFLGILSVPWKKKEAFFLRFSIDILVTKEEKRQEN